MSDNTLTLIFFFSAAILCPIMAILLKHGKMKTAFLPLPINPEIPVNWPYGLWPVGLGALLTGTGFIIANRLLMMIGLFGVTPFALVFLFWKPGWLKPDWLLWLEDHYDRAMLDLMFEQARRDKTWSQKVATQAGLEAWAKEMEQKYRYYRDDW